MINSVRELYEKASQLPDSDRAELAALLLESLEPPTDPGVEEAWAREIDTASQSIALAVCARSVGKNFELISTALIGNASVRVLRGSCRRD